MLLIFKNITNKSFRNYYPLPALLILSCKHSLGLTNSADSCDAEVNYSNRLNNCPTSGSITLHSKAGGVAFTDLKHQQQQPFQSAFCPQQFFGQRRLSG
jgi:hypothetical protein